MDSNNKIPAEPFTVLETPTFSTKTKIALPLFMNNLGFQLSSLYQTMKGELMDTINGKLVELNLVKPDEDELKTVYQPWEYEKTEVEILQQSVNMLENRIHEVESHASYLEKVCKKLQKEEKQNARKIMIITLVGTIGLGTLGVWGGLSYQESLAAKNAVNYIEIEEEQRR